MFYFIECFHYCTSLLYHFVRAQLTWSILYSPIRFMSDQFRLSVCSCIFYVLIRVIIYVYAECNLLRFGSILFLYLLFSNYLYSSLNFKALNFQWPCFIYFYRVLSFKRKIPLVQTSTSAELLRYRPAGDSITFCFLTQNSLWCVSGTKFLIDF